jgi:hypothetical protein
MPCAATQPCSLGHPSTPVVPPHPYIPFRHGAWLVFFEAGSGGAPPERFTWTLVGAGEAGGWATEGGAPTAVGWVREGECGGEGWEERACWEESEGMVKVVDRGRQALPCGCRSHWTLVSTRPPARRCRPQASAAASWAPTSHTLPSWRPPASCSRCTTRPPSHFRKPPPTATARPQPSAALHGPPSRSAWRAPRCCPCLDHRSSPARRCAR